MLRRFAPFLRLSRNGWQSHCQVEVPEPLRAVRLCEVPGKPVQNAVFPFYLTFRLYSPHPRLNVDAFSRLIRRSA